MPLASNILFATTHGDISSSYFEKVGVKVVYFEDEIAKFTKEVVARNFEIVYIRDPFNTGKLDLETIAPKLTTIKSSHANAYFVDDVSDTEGVLIEDKWRQYQQWEPWMPLTYIGGSDAIGEGPYIAKKRISARSRDIRFNIHPTEVSTDWIVQEQLVINEELRVYVLFGKLVKLASRRRPSGLHQATKVTGLRMLVDEEMVFMQQIVSGMKKFDLLGLDIATTPDGLRLIEVNRSPQFKRYNELCKGNLVADFWHTIQKRLDRYV